MPDVGQAICQVGRPQDEQRPHGISPGIAPTSAVGMQRPMQTVVIAGSHLAQPGNPFRRVRPARNSSSNKRLVSCGTTVPALGWRLLIPSSYQLNGIHLECKVLVHVSGSSGVSIDSSPELDI